MQGNFPKSLHTTAQIDALAPCERQKESKNCRKRLCRFVCVLDIYKGFFSTSVFLWEGSEAFVCPYGCMCGSVVNQSGDPSLVGKELN